MALNAGLWMYIIIITLVLLFAVFSNTFVMYCVYRFKRLRYVTNLLICNLAVSDILLAGFVMPQKLHDISHEEDFFEGDALCKIVNFSPVFIITSSIYTLVFVAFERRRAIKETNLPQITIQTLKKIIPGVWIFGFLVSLPTLLEYAVNEIEVGEGNNTRFQLSCGSQHMAYTYSITNAIFVAFVSYNIPVILMFYNYLQVAVFVWRKSRQINPSRVAAENARAFQKRVKIVKLLVIVAVIFALSWFPFFVLLIYAKITQTDASNDAAGFVNLFLIAMATFTTAYNVVLYVMFNPSFSRAMRQVFGCLPPDTARSGGRTSMVGATSMMGPSRVSTITKATGVAEEGSD